VTFEVHALMQNAHDIDAIRRRPVKEQMRAGGIFPVTGAHVVASAPTARIGGNGLDRRLDLAKINFRLVDAPARGCVVPNFLDIGLRRGVSV